MSCSIALLAAVNHYNYLVRNGASPLAARYDTAELFGVTVTALVRALNSWRVDA